MTSTVLRCHLLGSLSAVALIMCVSWVWSRSYNKVTTIQYEDAVIDLNEATALIENADQWRQLYTVNFDQSKAVDVRADAIKAWLPEACDWPNTETDIQTIGESAGLRIQSINQGAQHVGSRVGVIVVDCQVQGSYASLCRFLSALHQRPQPIACSEIELHRVNEDVAEAAQPQGTQQCQAKVSLRIPLAAAKSAAGQLAASPEIADAS
jgi:Tfp pilus assembly protein PilO